MIFLKKITLLLPLLVLIASCGTETPTTSSTKNPLAVTTKNSAGDPFKEYWYQGKAEITSYDLQQARYGEIHQGSAVLVFVTEDFSKKKQVKLDNPSASPKDVIPVLKLNRTRKFNTGIYPYSIMTSSFTPVDLEKNPNTIKVTHSSQEWCGHTFMQLNLEKNNYNGQILSYFESEGDKKIKFAKVLLEDEIWAKIRINPKGLPEGEIDVIPSATHARLRHINYKKEKATAKFSSNGSTMQYNLDYKDLGRTLSITFEKSFPHEIISWEESSKSGFGPNAKTLVTKAVRKQSIMLDYWSKNGLEDLHYRAELGLD